MKSYNQKEAFEEFVALELVQLEGKKLTKKRAKKVLEKANEWLERWNGQAGPAPQFNGELDEEILDTL